MGLDMTLVKKVYVRNWRHMKPHERHSIVVKRGGKVRTDINADKIEYVVELVGEWRKANAIHGWFVRNVQNGEDDCGSYGVSVEELVELRETCLKVIDASKLVKGKVVNGYTIKRNDEGEVEEIPMIEEGYVIEDDSVAKKLLPTSEGFFFGSTDYNEWYIDDLKLTVEIIDKALKGFESELDVDFEYSSSW